jgi:AcrR family transcriptional regulator
MNNGAGRATRERVLAAAERLFATRGIDAVSVRDITKAAGANLAAVNYYFGSKHGLIVAIAQRRADQLGQRRSELLDELEASGSVDLRSVIRAMVLPTAELVGADPSGRFYVSFLAALDDHPELVPVLDVFDASTERYLRVLARATPAMSHSERVLRFAVAKYLAYRLLGQPDGPIQTWVQRHGVVIDDPVASLIDVVTGLFAVDVDQHRVGATSPLGAP